MTDLVVSEIFGPTFQGEGPSTGRRAAFVRLGRCNLACAWCDTPYTWDWDRFDPAVELRTISVDEVLARLDTIDAPLVVVTGGEPLIQQRAVESLVARLTAGGQQVEIETAGTLAPSETLVSLGARFNVSPKLASSGNPRERRYAPDVLRAFEASGRASFKFVACGLDDLDEIAAIVADCGLGDVWVMPEGTEAAAVLDAERALADAVLARGWNLSSRLHVLLWGDERGR